MPLAKPVATWTEEDLLSLINNRTEESNRLEYKQELSLESPSQKKELCKDCSAFANAEGGIIIFGIAEAKQSNGTYLPIGLRPLAQGGLKERLENICLNGICPPMNMHVHSLPSSTVDSGYYLAVEIPQSFAGVHMVTLGGENRYYRRRNFQTSPIIESEISQAYARLELAKRDLDEQFEEQRTQVEGGCWISCAVLPVYTSVHLIDPRKITRQEIDELGCLHQIEGIPGGIMARTQRYGRIVVRFSGLMETVLPQLTDRIYSKEVIQLLNEALPCFGSVYSLAGYHGPVRVYYSVQGAKNTSIDLESTVKYRVMKAYRKYQKHYAAESFKCVINSDVAAIQYNPMPIIHKIMDYFWVDYGFERCLLFNQTVP